MLALGRRGHEVLRGLWIERKVARMGVRTARRDDEASKFVRSDCAAGRFSW